MHVYGIFFAAVLFIYLVFFSLERARYLDLHKFSCFWHPISIESNIMVECTMQNRFLLLMLLLPPLLLFHFLFSPIEFNADRTRCRLNDVWMQGTAAQRREKMEKFSSGKSCICTKLFAASFLQIENRIVVHQSSLSPAPSLSFVGFSCMQK